MNGHDRFLILGGVDKLLGCPGYERFAFIAVMCASFAWHLRLSLQAVCAFWARAFWQAFWLPLPVVSPSVVGCSSVPATVASVSQEAEGFYACAILSEMLESGHAL